MQGDKLSNLKIIFVFCRDEEVFIKEREVEVKQYGLSLSNTLPHPNISGSQRKSTPLRVPCADGFTWNSPPLCFFGRRSRADPISWGRYYRQNFTLSLYHVNPRKTSRFSVFAYGSLNLTIHHSVHR